MPSRKRKRGWSNEEPKIKKIKPLNEVGTTCFYIIATHLDLLL